MVTVSSRPSFAINRFMIFRYLRFVLFAGWVIVTLSACIYRMDIPQGNDIDAEVIERLEIGMTRNQVKFLLGTPAVLDPYRPDQWHYVYYLKTGNNKDYEVRRMTLSFTEDILTEIDGSLTPG